MPPPANSTSRQALVIQASFAPGKEPRPAKAAASAAAPAAGAETPARPAPAQSAAPTSATQKKATPAKPERPPHPAAAMQKKAAPAKPERPPHPATVAQKRAAPAKPERPPHPATVAQKRASPAKPERPPHPATVAQKKVAPSRAERPAHPATLPRGRKVAQAAAAQGAFAAPPDLLLMGLQERGEPLPATIQRAMEERFDGADFASVRVHEGPEAAVIGALALTAGDHVFFAPGQYRPETKSGRALLGKQLAYVLQQREGRVKNPFGSGVAVVRDPALEADAAARAGLAHR